MEVNNAQNKLLNLQFNASNNKSKMPTKMEEASSLLSPKDNIKPTILPKRVNTLKSEVSNNTNTDKIEEKNCDNETKEQIHQRAPSPAESLQKLSRIGRHQNEMPSMSSFNSIVSHASSPNFRRENSVKSLRGYHMQMINELSHTGKPSSSDSGSHISKPYSDAASVRSWASVGMGSTDGKKMIVRRVPTSPVELFNIVNPPTPPEEYLYDGESDDGSADDEDSVYIKPRRPNWSNKLQFVLACVGYSVGLGSIWRFPYLCYKSGGAVFLIPYAIIMIICGIPMLYMELAIGQFTGRGPIGALGHLCPLFKGTGLGSVVISFLMSTYYSVIIAYGVYYFFTSFRAKIPWEDCNHRWNTKFCWNPSTSTNQTKPPLSQSPAEEFYDRKVLQIGRGIEDFDIIRWELFACLICAWILIYFAIWKSIKSSAKVRYFTATFPFIFIIVLLIKSLMLEGADKGMKFFWKPNFELLLEAKVWINAACQTFSSMGCAYGSMVCFASYNKYNNNILYDTLAVSLVNAVTCLVVGIFAFATLGNLAHEQNTTIQEVIDDGPGLIFVVYPQTMAKMPASQLWAVFFFFMLICLALNSQFAIVEVVVTSIQDGFPAWIKKNLMCHEVLVLIICVISFLCGIPNVTQGGIYFFQLIDHYAASISIMYLAFFEVIGIAWFYGAWRLSKNVKTMTGRHPGLYIKFCWMIGTPLMIFGLWVFLIIDYHPPTYNNGRYHYPPWAIALGWLICALSIACIPIYAIVIFVQSPGTTFMEKLRNSLKSDLMEKCPKCNEMDCDCIIKDEECGPMLVMHPTPPDIKREATLTSMPFYSPVNTSPPLTQSENQNFVNNPSDTLSQYDNVNNENNRQTNTEQK